MMELFFSIGILVTFAVFCQILTYLHCPREQCLYYIKEMIMTKGLIHFTMIENAKSIEFEGLMPRKKKAMFAREKNFVWMYINDTVQF